jgi:hypothetical protein
MARLILDSHDTGFPDFRADELELGQELDLELTVIATKISGTNETTEYELTVVRFDVAQTT